MQTFPSSWCWGWSHVQYLAECVTATQCNPLNPTLHPAFNPSYRKSWNFLGANNEWQKQHSHSALVTLRQMLGAIVLTASAPQRKPVKPFSLWQSDGEFAAIITKLLDYSLTSLQPQRDTKMWVMFYSFCMFLLMSLCVNFFVLTNSQTQLISGV